MSSVNDNFIVDENSSISNFRNAFNEVVSKLRDASLYNIIRNPTLRVKDYDQTGIFGWAKSGAFIVDSATPENSTYTTISFTAASQELTQTLSYDPHPLDPVAGNPIYLERNTDYLLSYTLTSDNPVRISITATGGIINLKATGQPLSDLYTPVSVADVHTEYLLFRTDTDFDDLTIHITNEGISDECAVSIQKLRLVKGRIEMFDAVEKDFFLENIKFTYDVTVDLSGKPSWKFFDGYTWNILPVDLHTYATKAELYASLQGLDLKQECSVATTANIDLTSVSAIDGVTLVNGDRVLVKNQSLLVENGIYTFWGGSLARSTDFSAFGVELTTSTEININNPLYTIDGYTLQQNDLIQLIGQLSNPAENGVYIYGGDTLIPKTAQVSKGTYVFVINGSENSRTGWAVSTDNPVVGSTPIEFYQFNGAGSLSVGDGLSNTGNDLNLVSASQSRIKIDSNGIDTGVDVVTSSAFGTDTTTGILVKTGAGTTTLRTIGGTAGNIVVNNGGGASANPSINIGDQVVTLTGDQDLTNKTINNINIHSVAASDITVTGSVINLSGDNTGDNITAYPAYPSAIAIDDMYAPVNAVDGTTHYYIQASSIITPSLNASGFVGSNLAAISKFSVTSLYIWGSSQYVTTQKVTAIDSRTNAEYTFYRIKVGVGAWSAWKHDQHTIALTGAITGTGTVNTDTGNISIDTTLSGSSFTPTSHAASHVTGGADVIANVVAGGNSGLMSGTDKTKLDGVAASANNYSLPVATAADLGGVKQGTNVSINGTTGAISVATANGSTLGLCKAGTNVTVGSDGAISVASLPTATNTVLGGVKVNEADSTLGVFINSNSELYIPSRNFITADFSVSINNLQAWGSNTSNVASLAFDPNRNVLYAGTEKNTTTYNSGAVISKSLDYGYTWTAIYTCTANQGASIIGMFIGSLYLYCLTYYVGATTNGKIVRVLLSDQSTTDIKNTNVATYDVTTISGITGLDGCVIVGYSPTIISVTKDNMATWTDYPVGGSTIYDMCTYGNSLATAITYIATSNGVYKYVWNTNAVTHLPDVYAPNTHINAINVSANGTIFLLANIGGHLYPFSSSDEGYAGWRGDTSSVYIGSVVPKIVVVSDTVCYCMSSAEILFTKDGGFSWNIQPNGMLIGAALLVSMGWKDFIYCGYGWSGVVAGGYTNKVMRYDII